MKKIIFILILFLSCYLIYNNNISDKFYCVFMGDFLTENIGEGVIDYLSSSNKLDKYDESFVSRDYRITDLLRIIEYNEIKSVNGNDISLNRLVKKADVIVLSVGMNELYYKFNNDSYNIYNYMNEMLEDMEYLLEHIDKFNHKKVFVLGYYNVLDKQEEVNYLNAKLKLLVSNHGFDYIDLSKLLDNNPSYLEKNDSYLLNNVGYFKISQIIVEKLKKY